MGARLPKVSSELRPLRQQGVIVGEVPVHAPAGQLVEARGRLLGGEGQLAVLHEGGCQLAARQEGHLLGAGEVEGRRPRGTGWRWAAAA